jgi:sugar O-acyltransferase (sialic acid O-acetyltransferase NeuD family)
MLLYIFGAGTLAQLALSYARHDIGLEVSGFVVDDAYADVPVVVGLPVVGWSSFCATTSPGQAQIFVALGYREMRARARAFSMVRDAGFGSINLVARSAFVAKDAILGSNNFIMPGAVVEPGVNIGSNNIFWSQSNICHDTHIGHHNFCAARVVVGGNVRVGDLNFFGFGSIVLQGCRVGNETLVGAQALVRRDTNDLHQYTGSPAIATRLLDPQRGICVSP